MIYIITHKNVSITYPKWKGYRVLQVGGAFSEPAYKLVDNSGDNISLKNKTFCELTGLYWIWKNCKNDSVIGLVHYRRFFVYPMWKKIAGKIPVKYRMVSIKESEKILQQFDIIVPNLFIYKTSVWDNYKNEHSESDLIVVRKIIEERHRDHLNDFDVVFREHMMYGCNMFVARYEFVDKYCMWLFDILFEAEKRIDISQYDAYQKRVFGFLAERLLNVYIRHNNLKVYESIVDFIDN